MVVRSAVRMIFLNHVGRGTVVERWWPHFERCVLEWLSSRPIPMPTAMPSGFGVRRALAPVSCQVQILVFMILDS
jgi:hypothetical protein